MNLSTDIRLKRTNNTDTDFLSQVSLLDKFLQELNGEAQGDYAPHNKLYYLDMMNPLAVVALNSIVTIVLR
jgi:hypothetical protein